MSTLYINGQWHLGQGQPLTLHSPADDSLSWQQAAASTAQVQQAFIAAQNSFTSWRQRSLQQRIKICENFAGLLQDNQQILAQTICEETGKPLAEANTEVTAMANKVAISIAAQQQRAGNRHNDTMALTHRPHGVMAVFGPYNFPGHLANGHIVPALLAGNTVVFKPSEFTPRTAIATIKLWHQAGLPTGVINLVIGNADVGQALAQCNINGLLFTGSSSTGRLLHQQFAGKPEVLLALEMGGNNPLIIGTVDNTDVAVWHSLFSAFISAGQRCTCARRLIIVGEAAKFLSRLVEICQQLSVGHWQTSPFMGPVINKKISDALLVKQQQLQDTGGKILTPMRRLPCGQCYLSPGIIDMSCAQQNTDEEVFGPLLQVYQVEDFDTAVNVANNTKFGLAAGLISDSKDQQQQFCQQINAGVISINKPTAGASSELPFGGIGASGNHHASAFYAADYCAWPQAQSLGTDTQQQIKHLPPGLF